MIPWIVESDSTLRLRLVIPLLFCATLFSWAAPARAAHPGSAEYSRDPTRIFWLVQISDTHIGSEWYDEDARFVWVVEEALPVIGPTMVILTGDIVDGSINGIPASGQSIEEWNRYREIVDQGGLDTNTYLDLPGNHDAYGSANLVDYLAHSLNGETFGQTTRSVLLELPFGSYLVYGAATPGSAGNPFVEDPAFSSAVCK
jgi:predicted MPP superfamily phosphohydrolase